MVLEDFGVEEDSLANLELIYLPTELINTSTCTHLIIANDWQLKNFVDFVKKSVSSQFYVTFKAKAKVRTKQTLILTSRKQI